MKLMSCVDRMDRMDRMDRANRARPHRARLRCVGALALAASVLVTVATPSASAVPDVQIAAGACAPGQICFWAAPAFADSPAAVFELATADVESCVSLPEGVDARSFANRMDRYVTMYQSRECATEGDFGTYPGDGVFVPEVPYVVRAFQIWEKA